MPSPALFVIESGGNFIKRVAVVLSALLLVGIAATSTAAPKEKRLDTCYEAKKAVTFYRIKTWQWEERMGVQRTRASLEGRRLETHQGCPYLKWVAKLWQSRAGGLRAKYESYHNLPTNNDWVTSVRIAQRVFPGTASWLLSCSSAEGGHGRWVRFGGGDYYPGYEHTDGVGNWLQYRPSTFRGHYRRAMDYVRGHGFSVQELDWLPAWQSPMHVALAGGWAITHGQRSHWFASIGNGC